MCLFRSRNQPGIIRGIKAKGRKVHIPYMQQNSNRHGANASGNPEKRS